MEAVAAVDLILAEGRRAHRCDGFVDVIRHDFDPVWIASIAVSRIGEGKVTDDLVVARNPSFERCEPRRQVFARHGRIQRRDFADVEAVAETVAVYAAIPGLLRDARCVEILDAWNA